MGDRAFIVGPNASGKSNFIDAIRFMRDIAKPSGGGLRAAVQQRGGLSKIRSLAARRRSDVELSFQLEPAAGDQASASPPFWKYEIGISQSVGDHNPRLVYERVWKNGEEQLSRPNKGDRGDPKRLEQTYLEQINSNQKFREVADFFERVVYMHVVPQLLRYPSRFGQQTQGDEDYFGRDLIEDIARTHKQQRDSRLRKIGVALQAAVPQFKELKQVQDKAGVPHLEATYDHWRATGALQQEDQFSDGTLRLIGLLWVILKGDSTLLLEEPELSLHGAIVKKIPNMIHRILRQSRKQRQIVLSTHSADLISDASIAPQEVLVLTPHKEGTTIKPASSILRVAELVRVGIPLNDAVAPYTRPENIEQLGLFQ